MNPTMRRVEQLNRLFDLFAQHPDGMTLRQLGAALNVSRGVIQARIRELRQMFADDDYNIVGNLPATPRAPYVFQLVRVGEDTRWWHNHQMQHLESRLKTITAVAESVTHMTDGRSIEGKKARKIHRTLEYLEKELQDITA